jgi:hypothetical protein
MPVPDTTYYGETPEGQPIFYGDVRKIKDDQRKLEVMKSRIDSFMMRQMDWLSKKEPDGNYRVWSPFPLVILTFVAIETLGHVISDVEKIKDENEHEQSKALVTLVYRKMDKNLGYKPTVKFHEAFEKLHGKDDRKSLKTYSDIIHKYQRNTFNHGYQAKGVYLSHELESTWQVEEEGGYMIINPYRFWDLFKSTYENIFLNILQNKNKVYRINALKYFQMLVS